MVDQSISSASPFSFNVVITGGLGDIGQAIAVRLARMGGDVTLLDVHSDLKAQLLMEKLGHGIHYMKCDITSRREVDQVLSAFQRLDVVIVNAGIVRAGSFLSLSTQDWLDTLSVNLTGAFHTAQSAAQRMVKQEVSSTSDIRGRILFTGSWVQDMPHPGTFAYITSKGGLKMLAKTMAQELAEHRILVNVVAPGAVQAGLTKRLADGDEVFRREILAAVPLGAFQSVESVAAAFAYLCSPDADYMTGSTLLIDGGLSLVQYSQQGVRSVDPSRRRS